jgi:phosphoribosyl 1,2-cyclic phosphodiesterase
MTTFSCIASGSTGNCYLVNLGGGYIILDAGIPIQKIVQNVNLNDVLFACITHEHNDHKKSMADLKKRNVQVFYGGDNIKTKLTKFKNHIIIQVPVSHGETINNAFVIQYKNECILYATDFNLCEYILSDFKFTRVIVECNFIDSYVEKIDDFKTRRQINTHMSLDGLKIFLNKLNLESCEEIDLIHLSQSYGNEMIMGSSIYAKYKIPVCVCKQWGGVKSYGRG